MWEYLAGVLSGITMSICFGDWWWKKAFRKGIVALKIDNEWISGDSRNGKEKL